MIDTIREFVKDFITNERKEKEYIVNKKLYNLFANEHPFNIPRFITEKTFIEKRTNVKILLKYDRNNLLESISIKKVDYDETT